MAKPDIKRYSLEELEDLVDRSKSVPTRSDAPELHLDEDFWMNARVVYPEGPKKQLTIRLDPDIVAFFKTQGRGYQSRINAVLRSYVEAHRRKAKDPVD